MTEYCNGGDLRNFFEDSEISDDEQNNNESAPLLERVLDVFFQICEGFNYLRKF